MNQPIHDELQKTCAMIADATGGLVVIAVPTVGRVIAATPLGGLPVQPLVAAYCMIEDIIRERVGHTRESWIYHGGTAAEFDALLQEFRSLVQMAQDNGSSASWKRPSSPGPGSGAAGVGGGGEGGDEGAPS